MNGCVKIPILRNCDLLESLKKSKRRAVLSRLLIYRDILTMIESFPVHIIFI